MCHKNPLNFISLGCFPQGFTGVQETNNNMISKYFISCLGNT
jgi:hypothetical protein